MSPIRAETLPPKVAASSLVRDWWLPQLTIRTALLLPAGWLFRLAVALRRGLYRCGVLRSIRLSAPVVVVGNLTVGGSGKTPLVIALVRRLQEHGYRPGVISRGYGRRDADAGRLCPALEVSQHDDPARSGDEPLLIARATGAPVFVDADRTRAGRALLAKHPDVNVIVSDDGLQHYALARDVDIAVFDERGAGNRQMLPAGPLREPLSRATSLTALVRNDSGGDALKNGLYQRFPGMHSMKLIPQLCYRLIDPAQTCDALALQTGRAAHGTGTSTSTDTDTDTTAAAALAGIGNPARFFATLRAAGLTISEHPFPDHHAFTREDLAAIHANTLIMTEKDALKCSAFDDARAWVLPVAAQVDPALFELILERLRGRKTA